LRGSRERYLNFTSFLSTYSFSHKVKVEEVGGVMYIKPALNSFPQIRIACLLAIKFSEHPDGKQLTEIPATGFYFALCFTEYRSHLEGSNFVPKDHHKTRSQKRGVGRKRQFASVSLKDGLSCLVTE
jgi:hypothetical protein